MNELLHIKWINHNSQIVHNFQQLQKKQLFCDATIVCDGKCFPVHRLVLSSCSQYFEQIFKETPCAHPFIVLKDVEVEIFRDLVEFMYKGEVNILHNKLPIFISTANSLKVQGISSSDQLKASKSTEDGTSNIANLTKQSDIERKTIKALNVPNVSKESTSWCSLPSHTKTYPPKKTEGRKRELVCSSGQPEKKVRRPKEADNEEVCDTSDMNYNDTNETDDFKNDMEDIEITENNSEDFLTIVKSEEFKDDEIEITFPDITKLGKESDLTSLPSCSKSFISFDAGRSPTNKEKTQFADLGLNSQGDPKNEGGRDVPPHLRTRPNEPHSGPPPPSGPPPCQGPIQQQQPQGGIPCVMPQVGALTVSPSIIWQGTLEWSEKKHMAGSESAILRIPCKIFSQSTNGKLELQTDGWPSTLRMLLVTKTLLSKVGNTFFTNIHKVIFDPDPCPALESLTSSLSLGYAGCVHLSSSCSDVKMIILLFSPDKRAYVGFIPLDQIAFLTKIKQVFQSQSRDMQSQQQQQLHQQQQAVNKQNVGNPMLEGVNSTQNMQMIPNPVEYDDAAEST